MIRRERVANWLYGVAYRTAKQARGRAARRRVREEKASLCTHIEPADRNMTDELRGILDEELRGCPRGIEARWFFASSKACRVRRLPADLESPEGTLSSRLARAKARLRDRLARRGLSVSMIALSLAMVREANAAFVAEILMQSTAVAAMRIAAGSAASVVLSASVASLTEGVIKAMLLTKMKGIVLGLGTLGAIVSGAFVLAQSGPGTAVQRDAPARSKAYFFRETPIAVEPASQSDTDRTAAMEKKLDRILDALDRFAKTAPNPTVASISSGIYPSDADYQQTGRRRAASLML